MNNLLLNAITQGSPGITISMSAEDLKKVVNGMVNDERTRIQNAIETNREKPTVTRKEAARLLGVALPTLWKWAKSGYLIPVKIGTKVLYRYSDIEKMLTINS